MAFNGGIILVSHDDLFVAEVASRAMILSSGRLTEAEIHDHPHVHSHHHIHPLKG
ncbi:ATPase subunit of ABC transporter with duplicated ATPase domains [Agrobacterium vitis]|nr:ATPase subunit of ABC transporter with duplicated ATPase domains [Agrobacterium vitis]MBE1440448.1 ATPase subunit of ABC transporter with duplicated ATPase domains [Agrobacterium vitis]